MNRPTPLDPMTVAHIAYEANRALSRCQGDYSHPEWLYAHHEQQQSTYHGVLKLINNPHLTPVDLHGQWCLDKQRDGWVYGAVKDFHAKTHPCLVPYDELPETDRRKDFLFRGIVLALAFPGML